jgi:hypothetical protein
MKNRIATILVVVFAALAIALAVGCKPNVSIHITDKNYSPIVGARVERYRPPNICERIVNPVGSFYHNPLAEAQFTDSSGIVSITQLEEGGSYIIYAGTNQIINAKWDEYSFALTADASDSSNEWKYYVDSSSKPKDVVPNWAYSISWAKDDKIIGHSGSPTWRYPLLAQTKMKARVQERSATN